MTDWRALALGARRIPDDPAQDPVAGFLTRALGLDQPSLASRMQDLSTMQREAFARGEGPAKPGSERADLGLDVASNFNFLGTFAGPKAATANLGKLERAKKMAEIGYDGPLIHQETGWFKNPRDGQWRFEIDDSKAMALSGRDALLARNEATVGNKTGLAPAQMSKVFSHPELEAAYGKVPEVVYDPRMGNSTYGSYTRGNPGYITINKDIAGTNVPGSLPSERSAQLHEGQHFVQQRENFPRGGSPEEFAAEQLQYQDRLNELQQLAKVRGELGMQGKDVTTQAVGEYARNVGYPAGLLQKLNDEFPNTDDLMGQLGQLRQMVDEFDPFKRYERLGGEVEARAVQRRMDLTPEERAKRFPLDDYEAALGGPLSKMIIRR